MGRVVRRTVCRRLLREELWNGNLEPPLGTIFTYSQHIAGPRRRRPELVVVRLADPRSVTRWVEGPLGRVTS